LATCKNASQQKRREQFDLSLAANPETSISAFRATNPQKFAHCPSAQTAKQTASCVRPVEWRNLDRSESGWPSPRRQRPPPTNSDLPRCHLRLAPLHADRDGPREAARFCCTRYRGSRPSVVYPRALLVRRSVTLPVRISERTTLGRNFLENGRDENSAFGSQRSPASATVTP
jgi:hypothetical protein